MTAALEGAEWSAARPGLTLLPGKTRYSYRRLGGPQGWSGRAEKYIIYSMVKLLFVFLLIIVVTKFPFALLLSVLGLVTECIKNMYFLLADAGLLYCVFIKRALNLGINFHGL